MNLNLIKNDEDIEQFVCTKTVTSAISRAESYELTNGNVCEHYGESVGVEVTLAR
jgi:hypothetical protein